MGRKPNYFKTGMFVVLAGALTLAALVVFGSGLFAQGQLHFECCFDEAVTGLTVGSPVELRGIRIGQVEKIAFVRDEYEQLDPNSKTERREHYVMVRCSVNRGNLPDISDSQMRQRLQDMVDRGLRVRLSSNLVTGKAYLQADFPKDPTQLEKLVGDWESDNLQVPTSPGELATLKQSVDDVRFTLQKLEIEKLVPKVKKILDSIDFAIADANVGDMTRGVNDLVAKARRVFTLAEEAVLDVNTPAINNEILDLLAEARKTNEHLQKIIASPEASSQPGNLPEMLARLNKTLGRIDRLVTTERPQIELILANFREISENMKDLTVSIQQHPLGFFFSQPSSSSQPEVPK